jgi:hypothetical protein
VDRPRAKSWLRRNGWSGGNRGGRVNEREANMRLNLRSKTFPRPRRGIASVLAMLFLILFSALAVGFYATSTTSAQVSKNERTASEAMLAAEGGLQFMRYQLGSIDIPVNTTNAGLLSAVCAELGRLMDGTSNMGGQTVQISNSTIHIPSPAGWINLDTSGKSRFRATITQSGSFLILTLFGQGSDVAIRRTIQIKFQKAPRASAIFDYGVASRGKIVTSGSSHIVGQGDPARGSLLSTNMTDPTPIVIGGVEVSGDVSIVNPNGNVSYSGAKIGGSTNPLDIQEHIHKGVQPPEFPDIDTSAYAAYATTKYVGGSTLVNSYIPANMNPKFTGNTTIKGVLLVKAPNNITFSGNVDIQGAIVVENGSALDLSKNQINFNGSVMSAGVETLPESYGELRKMTGAFLLAPNFLTAFSGNFGTINGHIVGAQVKFWGNANGIVKGSVINLEDVQMDVGGTAVVTIASTGTTNYPTGVTFGIKLAPLPDTYIELPME